MGITFTILLLVPLNYQSSLIVLYILIFSNIINIYYALEEFQVGPPMVEYLKKNYLKFKKNNI